MALSSFYFESKYLRKMDGVTVILPDKPRGEDPEKFYRNGKKYPVLWLFHGTFGDHTDWIRHTRIELFACEKDCIVVMPSAINTNYQNWPGFGCGFFEYDYIVNELMPLIHNWFPASSKREDNFIAGLSMGARGALLLALKNPDKFGYVSCLSSFPHDEELNRSYYEDLMKKDYNELIEKSMNYSNPFEPAFRDLRCYNNIKNAGGIDEFINTDNQWQMVKEIAGKPNCPKMYFACGTDDNNYNEYLNFKAYAQKVGLKAEFVEDEGYRHEWRFWDKYIEKSFDFFGLPGETGGKELGGIPHSIH